MKGADVMELQEFLKSNIENDLLVTGFLTLVLSALALRPLSAFLTFFTVAMFLF
jgi:hypothetical protein